MGASFNKRSWEFDSSLKLLKDESADLNLTKMMKKQRENVMD
jgi:hypothetical protein